MDGELIGGEKMKEDTRNCSHGEVKMSAGKYSLRLADHHFAWLQQACLRPLLNYTAPNGNHACVCVGSIVTFLF